MASYDDIRISSYGVGWKEEMKIYKFRQGIIGDYTKDSDAFITRDKLVLGTSTYRGGTTDYMNFVIVNFGVFKPHFAWQSTEHNEKLKK